MAEGDAPSTIAPGTRIVGGTYEIEGLLKAGGMGEVYYGRNVHNGEGVAIKVVLASQADDQTHARLFEREALTLARLSHEAIVRYHIYTVDPAIGRPCLVMEFVAGPSLAERMAQGPMGEGDAITIMRRIALGLDAAHRREVIHRDLSPDNVILEGGLPEHAKLIDFGIAKQTRTETASIIEGRVVGKYNYMAPEQLGLHGGKVDPRADIYSLGLIAVGMFRGEPLDMGESAYEAVIRRGGVPDVSAVPERLRAVIARMLEPEPSRRPASMPDVLNLLERPERLKDLSTQPVARQKTIIEDLQVPLPVPGPVPPEPTVLFPGTPGGNGLGQPAPPPPDPLPPPDPSGVGTKDGRAPLFRIAAGGGIAGVAIIAVIGAAILLWPSGSESPVEPQQTAAVATRTGSDTPPSGGGQTPQPPTGGPATEATAAEPQAARPPIERPADPPSARPVAPSSNEAPTPGETDMAGPSPPILGPVAVNPGEPPPQGDRTAPLQPQTQEAGAPQTSAAPDLRTSQKAWIEARSGEACLLARLDPGSDRTPRIEVVSGDPEATRRLTQAFTRAFGVKPEVSLREAPPAQCPALTFPSQILRHGEMTPVLRLSNSEVAPGAQLEGRIEGVAGYSVTLLLIGQTGAVARLDRWLRPATGPGSANAVDFQVPLTLDPAEEPVEALLLALVTPRPVPGLAEIQDGYTAETVLPLVRWHLEQSGEPASVALLPFRLKS